MVFDSFYESGLLHKEQAGPRLVFNSTSRVNESNLDVEFYLKGSNRIRVDLFNYADRFDDYKLRLRSELVKNTTIRL